MVNRPPWWTGEEPHGEPSIITIRNGTASVVILVVQISYDMIENKNIIIIIIIIYPCKCYGKIRN